jgi:hypothetical protein
VTTVVMDIDVVGAGAVAKLAGDVAGAGKVA